MRPAQITQAIDTSWLQSLSKAPQQHGLPNIGTQHAVAQRHKVRGKRAPSSQRGYNKEWERFSKAFLLSNPLCEFCAGNGITRQARVTDHDLPHRHDPELFWSNTFTALCFPCHNSTKQRMEASMDGEDLLQAIVRKKQGRGCINL